MKTLIFDGSPRDNGNSAFCRNLLANSISGDIKTICAYKENISPCTDCRYCKENKVCRINDNMKYILEQIESANNIIIVSPLYFSTLTGELLSLFSRTQIFYNTQKHLHGKKGTLILLGGGASKNTEPAKLTGRVILKQLGCESVEYIVYTDTDNVPAWECGKLIEKLKTLGFLPPISPLPFEKGGRKL